MTKKTIGMLTLAVTLSTVPACQDDGTGPGGGPGAEVWLEVAAGATHACALTSEGRVLCWGANTRGQLGAGSTDPAISAPVPVAAANTFAQIDAGGDFTCGRTGAGEVLCWGANDLAQLGDGSPFDQIAPAPLAEAGPWTDVSVGTFHACAVAVGGRAHCWGGDRFDVALGYRASFLCTAPFAQPRWPCQGGPEPVEHEDRFTTLQAGLYTTCGLTTAGEPMCWGLNDVGQLGASTNDLCAAVDPLHGNDERLCSREPVAPAGSVALEHISPGTTHACGLAGGDLYCWGGLLLNFGQVGDGGLDGSPTPVPVGAGRSFAEVSTSHAAQIFAFSCAIAADSSAWCWGANRWGQLGASTPGVCGASQVPCSTEPVLVGGGHEFATISVGQEFACAVTTDGRLFCWGLNDTGQLGGGTTAGSSPDPVEVALPAAP